MFFFGVIFISCGAESPPNDDVAEAASRDIAELPEDEEWQAPEPGSERLRSTTSPEREPAPEPADPEEVEDEFLLHLTMPPGSRAVPAMDSEIGRLGSRYSGVSTAGDIVADDLDTGAYTVVQEFFRALMTGDFAADFVDAQRQSTVRRRLQPVVDGDVSFAHFRIGVPNHSGEETIIRVRLFPDRDITSDVSGITGEVYLDNRGSIEDVQIDVLALEE